MPPLLLLVLVPTVFQSVYCKTSSVRRTTDSWEEWYWCKIPQNGNKSSWYRYHITVINLDLESNLDFSLWPIGHMGFKKIRVKCLLNKIELLTLKYFSVVYGQFCSYISCGKPWNTLCLDSEVEFPGFSTRNIRAELTRNAKRVLQGT